MTVETPKEVSQRKAPIYPYLVWLTNDMASGEVYLKIDALCFHIGPCTDNLAITKAIDLFVKAYHVFALRYHPYLSSVFNYLECLYRMSEALPSVSKLKIAIREMAKVM